MSESDEKTFKYGDTIPVKEKDRKRLTCISRRLDACRIGMIVMSEAMEVSERELWETISELYPETKPFDVVYDTEKQEIVFRLKKDKL